MTGTALFVYGMAYGVRNGILDHDKYMPVITKAWNAMAGGKPYTLTVILVHVQGTGQRA